MPRASIPGPYAPEEMRAFLDSFFYDEEALLLDEVIRLDRDARSIEARLDTLRPLPFAQLQRVTSKHPAHVAAGELLMVTGSLGFLHAWFFHECRWDDGWVGFGSRIHRAEFRRWARRGPDLQLFSRETRTRVRSRRIVLRFEFRFVQEGELVYFGDQTAMFVKDREAD